jgi:hypothetical protein
MSRARDLADLGGSADAGTVTGSNLIINGDMAVSQRGTSETGITSSKYANAPDRFKAGMYDCGTWTASQSTTSPDGFSNSYKLACTTAKATLGTGSNVQLIQRFEGQNLQHLQKGTSGAKSITISFYVRTNKTGTYTLELFDRDNTRVFSKTYSVSSADTWEYKSVTFDGDTTGAFDNDNAVSLDVSWWLAAGTDYTSGTFSTGWAARTDANRASPSQVNVADSTSNTWHITGVKLEVGSTATPFQHESYAENLRKCQRYFETNYPDGNYPGDVIGDTIGAGLTFRTGQATSYENWPFKVRKRANPTMVAYNGLDGGTGDWRGSNSTDYAVTLYDNEEYFSAGIAATDTAIRSAFYTVDAEL